MIVYKKTSLTCVHTVYTNQNINRKACYKNFQPYMCTYPLQQQKHKHLPSTAPSMKPFKYPITLLPYVQIGSPYTAPSFVPINLPSQKHSSYPTSVPGSNPTTNQGQVPRKKPQNFNL